MKNKHLKRTISRITGCLLFILIACQENIIYHSYQPIKKEGWYRNDTLIFFFDTTLASYSLNELEIGIRHLDSYPYKDLWIGIFPINQDSSIIAKADSIHLYLTDTIGNWEGAGIGELKQLTLTNKQSFRSSQTDSIIGLKIVHFMQNDPLQKIMDIGLCIKEH